MVAPDLVTGNTLFRTTHSREVEIGILVFRVMENSIVCDNLVFDPNLVRKIQESCILQPIEN